MSLLTQMVLITGMSEDAAVQRLNDWCQQHHSFRLQVFMGLDTSDAGGRKVFCDDIWAMCGNDVPYRDLLEVLPTFAWHDPESVFLFVDHEGEPAAVYSAVDSDAPLQLAGSSSVPITPPTGWGGQPFLTQPLTSLPTGEEQVARAEAMQEAVLGEFRPEPVAPTLAQALSSAIDAVQAVRNQFEPSYALVEFTEALIGQLMAVRRGEPWPVPEVAHADGPDADCPHMEFEAGVTVQRILGDNLVVAGFWAEVMVACTGCNEVFRWTGVQPGLSPAGPRVSIDHRTLLAPFHRASRDPDEGQGLPGFDVNIIGPELGHERTAAAIRRRALEDAAELVKGRQTPVMSIAARRELRHAEAELRRAAREVR